MKLSEFINNNLNKETIDDFKQNNYQNVCAVCKTLINDVGLTNITKKQEESIKFHIERCMLFGMSLVFYSCKEIKTNNKYKN